jgi:hypothetical protein
MRWSSLEVGLWAMVEVVRSRRVSGVYGSFGVLAMECGRASHEAQSCDETAWMGQSAKSSKQPFAGKRCAL